jgi:hypothetical protein
MIPGDATSVFIPHEHGRLIAREWHADCRVYVQERTTDQVGSAISRENEDMTHAYLLRGHVSDAVVQPSRFGINPNIPLYLLAILFT